MRRVVLYTIGPGTPLFERYGHSLLCVQDSSAPDESGTCTDYGVARATGLFDLAWGTLRGRELFVATAVPEHVALDVFRGEGRAIERQLLPLDAEHVDRLAATMRDQVDKGWSYAYHPRTSNCASHPRDLIDTATEGRLMLGAETHGLPTDPDLARYRDQLEAGLSGHLFELTVAELVAGTPAEPKPSPWQTMYQPERLRDGVAAYLDAAPELLARRVDQPLPTSPSIGRGFLLVLAIGLYFLCARRVRFARIGVALLLGVPALALDALALVSTWPELSHNWTLALLWPTDLALPWMPERVLIRYAMLRLGVAATIALGELGSVVQQPILPLAALAGLPMLGMLHAARKPKPAAAPALA